MPQAGLQAARGSDQQLVADQVTQAVVDDLESIEVEIQDRELVADATQLELFEAPPQPLHEHRAVEEPGQRIEESDAAQPLLRDGLFRRICERSSDAVASRPLPLQRQTAAE